MRIDVDKHEAAVIVSVDGRIDTVSAQEFQDKVEELLDEGAKMIVLDFEKLQYVSSAGLRSILVAARKAKSRGGAVSCCSLQTMVRKVFDLSGFTSMITVFDSRQQALGPE